MRVAQGHVLRFPPAVRLHHVERSVVEEGIERPVVPQIVGREALDADLAAKDSDALIDGAGGQRLFRVVAGEERSALPSHLREVGLGRHPLVSMRFSQKQSLTGKHIAEVALTQRPFSAKKVLPFWLTSCGKDARDGQTSGNRSTGHREDGYRFLTSLLSPTL